MKKAILILFLICSICALLCSCKEETYSFKDITGSEISAIEGIETNGGYVQSFVAPVDISKAELLNVQYKVSDKDIYSLTLGYGYNEKNELPSWYGGMIYVHTENGRIDFIFDNSGYAYFYSPVLQKSVVSTNPINKAFFDESNSSVHTHTFDTDTYEYDNTYHWHPATCEHTSEVSSKEEHTFNEDGSCWYCEYIDRTGDLPDIGQIVTAPNGLEIGVGADYVIVLSIGSCTDTNVVIPSECEGHPVTGIADRAFEACQSIEGVVIPDTVTVIGEGAFGYCENLKSVTLSSNLTEIRPTTFIVCGALESINLPEGIETIGMSAFNGCRSLTKIIIPDSVTEIGDYAFEECVSATTLYLSNTLSTIGEAAFGGCEMLDGVMLPESLSKLGVHAFSGCALSSVTIPGNIREIEARAFANCRELETVTIENGVKIIGYGAFENSGVKTLYIPESVVTFGEDAFDECDVESVYIEDLTAWCKASFENIDAQPMNDLYAASTLYVDNVALTELSVPAGITAVKDYAFMGVSLDSIDLPSSVTAIGKHAFEKCGISEINILGDITDIGSYAFAYNDFESFVIPSEVTRISQGAFMSCEKLASVTIHKNITHIDPFAFWSCIGLAEINYGGTSDDWALVLKDYEWDYNTGNYAIIFAN